MTMVFGESERFSTMEQVAKLKMEGQTDTAISKQLSIPRKEVKELFGEYRTILQDDAEARDLAKDYLYQMTQHFDRLIKKYYELLDEINTLDFNHQVAAQKNSAIKSIAELESKRLDALQKAGLLESHELGDELIQMEEERDFILGILRNDLCPACQQVVARRLSDKTDKVEALSVELLEQNTIDGEVVEDE